MGKCSRKISPFIVSVSAAIALTVAVIICSVSFGGTKIDFSCGFYFVCYAVKDNAVSAGAVSENVANLGGAGYVFGYKGNYYATVSCYYSENDAVRVKQSLLRRGLNCSVLEVERDEYLLKSGKKSLEKLYKGNLNTLLSLSKLCYECANGLDGGSCSQTSAKAVLADVEKSLNGLKSANPANCFTEEIKRLTAECKAADGGFIYSKSLRKLQIAIIDTIVNIDLY